MLASPAALWLRSEGFRNRNTLFCFHEFMVLIECWKHYRAKLILTESLCSVCIRKLLDKISFEAWARRIWGLTVLEPTLLVCLRMKVFGDIQARASGRWNTRKEGPLALTPEKCPLGPGVANRGPLAAHLRLASLRTVEAHRRGSLTRLLPPIPPRGNGVWLSFVYGIPGSVQQKELDCRNRVGDFCDVLLAVVLKSASLTDHQRPSTLGEAGPCNAEEDAAQTVSEQMLVPAPGAGKPHHCC
ncbi:hypothetical protein MJT46_012635 [Ovis ammon polii x Ovis aries]|nr:hypothetical protein MJT46_012635 [Ovis ammon polii x Ovis aries]